jgi:hypothetical protein
LAGEFGLPDGAEYPSNCDMQTTAGVRCVGVLLLQTTDDRFYLSSAIGTIRAGITTWGNRIPVLIVANEIAVA